MTDSDLYPEGEFVRLRRIVKDEFRTANALRPCHYSQLKSSTNNKPEFLIYCYDKDYFSFRKIADSERFELNYHAADLKDTVKYQLEIYDRRDISIGNKDYQAKVYRATEVCVYTAFYYVEPFGFIKFESFDPERYFDLYFIKNETKSEIVDSILARLSS